MGKRLERYLKKRYGIGLYSIKVDDVGYESGGWVKLERAASKKTWKDRCKRCIDMCTPIPFRHIIHCQHIKKWLRRIRWNLHQ
ncbi:MAG: hypothetical protein GY782_08520 [Gammaproteobacteria bacterium]|nr:hypothetical protein [Gammaproteobacteria bacterium]